MISVIVIWFIVLMMPHGELPDKMPDGKGGMDNWDDAKKIKMKHAILIAVPVFGFLVCCI